MSDFVDLTDLAAERLGGAVLAANDEFFAPKENLLKAAEPVFLEGKYTDVGKWMDGWETRRRRDSGEPGHDWAILRLGLPGIPRGVVVDTRHFRGNYPESCSLDACAVDGHPAPAELAGAPWREILPLSKLQGDSRNVFPITQEIVLTLGRVTHLRLNIHPDGGVARLRVHGEVVPDWRRLARRGEIDLAGVENGGAVLACSDMFFGNRHNLILPGPSLGMHDGWETKRRRGPGHDWAIVQLGHRGRLERIEVDTSHFKGNAPGSCILEACDAPGATLDEPPGSLALEAGQSMHVELVTGLRLLGRLKRFDEHTVVIESDGKEVLLYKHAIATLAAAPPPAEPWQGWREILPQTPLRPHTRHLFDALESEGPFTHVRLNIYPDGGVARLRLFGKLEEPPEREAKVLRMSLSKKQAG